MKKKEIVKSKIVFNKIINNNDYVANHYFVIYQMLKDQTNSKVIKPNFGIAINTKFGIAVLRNKYKRITRVIIDNNKNLFPNNYNYIIMIRKDAKGKDIEFLNQQFVNLVSKRYEA